MRMRLLSIAIMAAFLAGCLNYSLMPPVRTKVANNAFSIEPGRTWNKNAQNQDERWTLDGNSLQELIFFNAVSGQPLSSTRLGGSAFGTSVIVSKKEKLPPLASTMTLLDVQEFIEASLTQLDAVDLYVANFQPGKFGNADGFRFDIQFAYKSGLIAKGFVVGTIAGGRLVGMIFTAAETYYYARDLPEAERIVASIEFGGTVAAADRSLARAPAPIPSLAPSFSAPPAPAPAFAAPAPQTVPQPASPPAAAANRLAYVPAPIAAALPPCSSLPMEQPPGTRNINDIAGNKSDHLLPVAAPRRVDKPCVLDDAPQGTTIRDLQFSGTSARPGIAAQPVTTIAKPGEQQRPAFAVAPITASPLPLCSSLPMVQPPGTRSINDAVLSGKDGALLPVAAPVRANQPCIPDNQPQGTTIQSVISPGTGTRDTLKPITAIAGTPPSAPAAPAALPPCSSLPYEQPPGTRNINEATIPRTALLPVAAPVRVNKPCIPDAPTQGTTIQSVINNAPATGGSLKPVTAIAGVPPIPAPSAPAAVGAPPSAAPALAVVPLPPCPAVSGTNTIADAVRNPRSAAPVTIAPTTPCTPNPLAAQPAASPADAKPVSANSSNDRPAFVVAPIVEELPLCSSLPMEQPPGTRSIADMATSKAGLDPVAPMRRVQKPCRPD